MLHQAIAKQSEWQARPKEEEVRRKEEVARRPRTKNGGIMALPYAYHIDEWVQYATDAPRNMKELIAEMKQLSGKSPAQSSIYHWCEDRKITIRIDRHRTGAHKIGNELLTLSNQGYSGSALVDYAESKGYKLTEEQIRSAVAHARRGVR